MYNRSFAAQYRQTAVTSAVLDADPHRLVALMLAGVRERVRLAAACIERGDLARKGQAINETCTIIGSLDGSLDMDAGGEIASNLSALYDYAQHLLLDANVNNTVAPLHEIDALFGDLEGAWNAISPQARPQASVAPRANPA